MIIKMMHGCGARNDHTFRVAKRAIKIRNENHVCRFSGTMSLSHIVCRLYVACDMFVRI